MSGHESSEPGPGSEFAGHKIEAIIGRGGMGVVFRARNVALDRDRALKVLAPSLSSDERFRERFKRESRLAASIEHPHVIPVHQAGEEGGQLFISMRLVEGRDLRRLIEDDGALQPAPAIAIVRAVAAALDAAHSAGLVHRDVKPANVLVGDGDDSGRVYITDFGISRTTRAGETVTSTGELMGTADFIAPEQIAGDPIDGRADIYALGGVLHFALTGQPPFDRETELATMFAHANAPRPLPSELRPGVAPALDAIVARAMATKPGNRYSTAAEMVAALDASSGDEAVTAPLDPPRAARGRSGMRRWAGPAALASAALVAALVLVLGDGDDATPEPETTSTTTVAVAPQPTTAPPIRVGAGPTGITVGPGRTWVAAREGGKVESIDPGINAVDDLETTALKSPTAVAVGHDSIWAISDSTDTLYRLNPGDELPPIKIPLGPGADPSDIAVDDDWVWVTNEGAATVVRIDPETNAISGEVEGVAVRAIATGGGSVWVTNIDNASVSQIDPDVPARLGNPIEVSARPSDIAVGEGAVWVISNFEGTVTQIDPELDPPLTVGQPIDVGAQPRGIKAGIGFIWVALGEDDSVVRVDPESRQLVGDATNVGDNPSDIALGLDSVWTSNEGAGTVTRIDPEGQPSP